MVVGAAADHAVDPVAITFGQTQRFEYQRAHAFAWDEAIVACAIAAAGVADRQHAAMAERLVLGRMQIQVDAAGQRELAIAAPQALAGQMHRDQRRRTRGVHGNARALQIQGVGHAVGDRPGHRAGRDHAPALPGLGGQQLIGVGGHAHEHADIGALAFRVALLQAFARVAGIFNRGPGGLQETALLRVDDVCFGIGDVEEAGVELVEVLQETAALAIDLALLGLRGVGIVERRRIPAVFGHALDEIGAGAQMRPQRVHVVGLRERGMHADDGDRLGMRVNIRIKRGCGNRRRLRPHGDGCVGDRRCRRRGVGRDGIFHGCRSADGGLRCALARESCGQRGRRVFGQIRRQLGDGLVFVHQGLRQIAEVLFQGRIEASDHDRVEAERLEAFFDIDPVNRNPGFGMDQPAQIGAGLRQQDVAVDHRPAGLRRVGSGGEGGGGTGDSGAGGVAIGRDFRGIAVQRQRPRQIGHQQRVPVIEADFGRQRAQPGPFLGAPQIGRGQLHAAGLPVRPADRQGLAEALAARTRGVAMFGECVHERIGVGVVGLADVAEAAGARREQYEQVQRLVGGEPVQMQRALHLRRQHPAELRVVLADQQRIVVDAGAVQHAVQRAEACLNVRDQCSRLLRIGDVRLQIHRFRAERTQLFQRALDPRIQDRATADRQPGAVVFGQMAREQHAQAAKAAGDEIRPALLERHRPCGHTFRRLQRQRAHRALRRCGAVRPVADFSVALRRGLQFVDERCHGIDDTGRRINVVVPDRQHAAVIAIVLHRQRAVEGRQRFAGRGVGLGAGVEERYERARRLLRAATGQRPAESGQRIDTCVQRAFDSIARRLRVGMRQQACSVRVVDHPGRRAALAPQCVQQRLEMLRLTCIHAEVIGGVLPEGIAQTDEHNGLQRRRGVQACLDLLEQLSVGVDDQQRIVGPEGGAWRGQRGGAPDRRIAGRPFIFAAVRKLRRRHGWRCAGRRVEGRGWGRGQLWPVAFLREGIARQPVKPLRQVARVERRPFELRALYPERGKRGRLARAVPQQQIGGLFGRNHRILAARHRAAMAATAAEG